MKKIFVLFMIVSGLFLTSCEKDNFNPQSINQIDSNSSIKRTCGMHEKMEKLLSDPAYKAMHEKKLNAVNRIEGLLEYRSEPVTLPMAVHFEGVQNPDVECLIALAKSQIAVLNEDYGGTNSDLDKWESVSSSYFPGINNGKSNFKFCLASKNHPAGYGLSDGDLAVTINKVSGDKSTDWAGYLNIFVIPNTGVLGYSPLGGMGDGDGVVIDSKAFGRGQGCGEIAPSEPYNLGRTLTHELGHYLLLDHIWGGGCGIDDEVADTPDAEKEYYGCPSVGVSSCGSTDMFMNYMDYVNDACMYMFSEGQVTRSSNYITTSLQNLVNNAAKVCGKSTDTPTCSDGIQNGLETGVDCGGPDCIPCGTSGECAVPDNFKAIDITEESVIISWDSISSSVGYKLKFRPEGIGAFSSIDIVEPIAILTGLEANTTYEYKVKSICASDSSDYSSIQTFKTGNYDSGCEFNSVELKFVLDDYGSDISWELIDEEGEVLYEGADYPDYQSGEIYKDSFCLADGCYTLIVNDFYEDGLCCEYGDGSFSLSIDGVEFAYSDGVYGADEIVEFCIDEEYKEDAVRISKRETSPKVPSKIEAARIAKKR